MVTHRVAEIVKSRGDLTDQEIGNISEQEAWQWIRTHAPASEPVDDERLQIDGGDPTH